MSFSPIPVWITAATVVAGFALLFYLRGHRKRRLAAENRHRALVGFAEEEQRVARVWEERDRERRREAETATRRWAAAAAPQAERLEEAHAQLASVALENGLARRVLVDLEEEVVPITAVAAPTCAVTPTAPGEATAVAAPAAVERHDGNERPVRFQVLWHGSMKRQEWCPLLVYMYGGWDGFSAARADFRRRIAGSLNGKPESVAAHVAELGVPITIIPEAKGFVFNPPAVRTHWLERWQRVEFRMRASDPLEASDRRESVRGRVAFFAGPLLVGEAAIRVEVLPGPGDEALPRPTQEPSGPGAIFREYSTPAYRSLFVSYSHDDAIIVEELEKAQQAIRDSHLKDLTILRSAESWSPAMLRDIHRADVFQLCWSDAAKNSAHVEQEWQCALGVNRRGFVRPIYWELPMPDPPEQLRRLHFTYVDMYS